MRPTRSLFLLVALLGWCAVHVASTPLVSPFIPLGRQAFRLPSQDEFYKVDVEAIKGLAVGSVIDTRDVTSVSSIQDSKYLFRSIQIKFRTVTAEGQPDATITTLFIPKKPIKPAKIQSVQIWEDSACFDCSISFALISGSKASLALAGPTQTTIFHQALQQGWYVVAPDHEGSKSAFGTSVEGKVVLDSLRAILNTNTKNSRDELIPQDAKDGYQAIMTGYSGGAHATASAATQAKTYAPELNIMGAAFGGTPINPRNLMIYMNKGQDSYFAMAGLVGFMNAYTDVNDFVTKHLTANGTEQVAKYRNEYCYLPTEYFHQGEDIFNYTDLGQALLDEPVVKNRLDANIVGKNERGEDQAIDTFPMLIHHATIDDTTPFQDAVNFVDTQCKLGAKIRFVTPTKEQHAQESFASYLPKFEWFQQRFQGKGQIDSCTREVTTY